MKKLAMILLMTLAGTIAQAAPSDTPAEFADYHCGNTDDGEACIAGLKANPFTQTMNHYSITIQICSNKNIEKSWNRSTCLVKAAKSLRDREFTEKVIDCRHDENFWGTGPKNETWSKVADCQSAVFAKRAADIDRKGSGGEASAPTGSRR